MEKLFVYFKADEQDLVCCNPFRVSSKKVAYIEAHFDLGENWTGYDSVRAIWKNTQNLEIVGTVLDSQGICDVPTEVLTSIGQVEVNLVGSISENDVLTDRLTSYPVEAGQVDANALVSGSETQPITPSQFEQFAANVRSDAERAAQSAEDAEGHAEAAAGSAENAAQSAQAAAGSAASAADDADMIAQMIEAVIQEIDEFEGVTVSVETLPPGSQATASYSDGHLNLGIPRGDTGVRGPQGIQGETGNGIASIAKTGTSGLEDTYTITYTNGQSTTFVVTNGAKGETGNGIDHIALTSTSGAVHTYTIYFTDGTTTTFEVTDGEVTMNMLESVMPTDTASGEIASFPDGSDVFPAKSLKVELEPIQDGTPWMDSDVYTEPYTFKATPQLSEEYNSEYDEIIGASVGWNQLVDTTGIGGSTTGVTFTLSESGSRIGISGTSTGTVYRSLPSTRKSVNGHVYYADCDTTNANVQLYNDGSGVLVNGSNPKGVGKATAEKTWYIRLASGITYDESIYPQLTDLTLMLGSVIADYVYSLEQSTAGSGVAWLKSHFPLFNSYQPYDAGSIKSVSGLQSHEIVGKNLFGKTLINGYLGINDILVNGQTYAVTAKLIDATKATYLQIQRKEKSSESWSNIGSVIAGTSANAKTFTADLETYDYSLWSATNYIANIKEIQLELGSTATAYEPYIKHTYPLDSSVTLRGIYKMDADHNLYADGDVYKADGTVTRKYGVVDLGTLTWSYLSSDNVFFATLSGLYRNNKNLICSKYPLSSAGISAMADKTLSVSSGTNETIWIKDTSYTDATTFKASLNGVMLVYELATPTTETALPYTNPQNCEYGGTEEYVGAEIAVGHETRYARIEPIYGHTEVVTEVRGKNQLAKPIAYWETVPNVLSEYFFVKEGTYTLNIGNVSGATNWRYAIRMKDAEGNDLSESKYCPNTNMSWYTSNRWWLWGTSTTEKTAQITIAEDCYIRILFASGNTSASTVMSDVQLEFSSIATTYEPYQGDTYTTDLGQTVYGGTLDVVSGVLTVDMAMVDLGTLNWSASSSSSAAQAVGRAVQSSTTVTSGIPTSAVPNLLCSDYQVKTNDNIYDGVVSIGVNSNGNIKLYDTRFLNRTTTEIKEMLSGVQLVYPLTTPTIIQLTPQEVEMLKGQNNIWSDSGVVEVTYKADIQKYIEKMLA